MCNLTDKHGIVTYLVPKLCDVKRKKKIDDDNQPQSIKNSTVFMALMLSLKILQTHLSFVEAHNSIHIVQGMIHQL
jgi:hypothetical protein